MYISMGKLFFFKRIIYYLRYAPSMHEKDVS